jgi:hypothetical protein
MDREEVVVLTHEQLEPMKCGIPGCEACDQVLNFANACHPFAPLAALSVLGSWKRSERERRPLSARWHRCLPSRSGRR